LGGEEPYLRAPIHPDRVRDQYRLPVHGARTLPRDSYLPAESAWFHFARCCPSRGLIVAPFAAIG
jgi:hypothetical protein